MIMRFSFIFATCFGIVAINGYCYRTTSRRWRLPSQNPSVRKAFPMQLSVKTSNQSAGLLLKQNIILRPYTALSKLSMSEKLGADDDEGSANTKTIFGLSFRQPSLNFIATAVALSYSRPIPRPDVAFSIAYPLYLVLANRFRFNLNAPAKHKEVKPLNREDRGSWFKVYTSFFGLIGILLPIFACLLAPPAIANALAPHLYLTCCQVGMEVLTGSPGFYPWLRLLVPIGFNTYRLGALTVWVSKTWNMFMQARTTTATSFASMLWAGFGLTLAVVNMVAWIYNLFVFLLLRIVPQYLNPGEFPFAKVEWKGQLIPVVVEDD